VRGRSRPTCRWAPVTWFRVGGPAEVLFRPADVEDLRPSWPAAADVPVTVLGVGSNLLVRDGGVPGVVIRLAARLRRIDPSTEAQRIVAGARRSI
jgi:UDP-N-acetylmuramate dehydrogenase